MMGSSTVPSVLSTKVKEMIPSAKVLVVGAGGIGCEILKNLALSGFSDIEIIDLDTIDVSNLNRQFLFRKEHVGKSKAEVARESILNFNPSLKIKAYHDSITTQQYGVNFFKRFKVVLNALDNRAARNHVNRMCLAADVPLIESGTSGYSGQVEIIKKGITQCYECQPKPPQRTFPGCTIRNTPSEPVHCIVWAKHLFNQLFGEADAENDVSPDTADPEAAADAGNAALEKQAQEDGNIQRVSTRQWAQDCDYEPAKLFNKFFQDDITYLLSMENLWKSRKPPKPLSWSEAASHEGDVNEEDNVTATDMKVWSINRCARVFSETVANLKAELKGNKFLVWDKDDQDAMDFVTACANIRAHIFSIPQKSRFDIKSIAGNIIPAIATANSIIAGIVVLYAFRVLAEEYDQCKAIYLRQKTSGFKGILVPDNHLVKANPKCYVCSEQPSVNVFVDVNGMTVKEFETEILKKSLNMVAPDALLEGKMVMVISSEEGETESNDNKKLSELGIMDGSVLKVDDFLQNYELTVIVNQYKAENKEDPPYKIVADPNDLKAKAEENQNGKEKDSNNKMETDDSNDDVELIENNGVVDDPQEGTSSKRRKLNLPDDDDDDLIMLD
ncbi:SUMO-activating enzyme subunit 2 isoform X3 [Agrilus planipennis]|uniref:SUMO-activating enzyme subunit n=1 Tax=Agrilus planipennis TaxID=224129 RepID=A0A1W4WFV1_AGRPL|nr:SUMO-activating enzyme subunit 2 isoform X1 [Agrilus planipennis]XP_018322756.1 SUMO-activating enzyme subunit 2 isoform X2 [Agrilus planipennis]XP_018322831.1 SUMO-activating enzyme subunit 2 isoform X3 [Agrilus planipennis]